MAEFNWDYPYVVEWQLENKEKINYWESEDRKNDSSE